MRHPRKLKPKAGRAALSREELTRINVRVPEYLYRAASEKAAAEQENGVLYMGRPMSVTAVITEGLRRYVEGEIDACESV